MHIMCAAHQGCQVRESPLPATRQGSAALSAAKYTHPRHRETQAQDAGLIMLLSLPMSHVTPDTRLETRSYAWLVPGLAMLTYTPCAGADVIAARQACSS